MRRRPRVVVASYTYAYAGPLRLNAMRRDAAMETLRMLAKRKGRVVVEDSVKSSCRLPIAGVSVIMVRAETAPRPDWKRVRT